MVLCIMYDDIMYYVYGYTTPCFLDGVLNAAPMCKKGDRIFHSLVTTTRFYFLIQKHLHESIFIYPSYAVFLAYSHHLSVNFWPVCALLFKMMFDNILSRLACSLLLAIPHKLHMYLQRVLWAVKHFCFST